MLDLVSIVMGCCVATQVLYLQTLSKTVEDLKYGWAESWATMCICGGGGTNGIWGEIVGVRGQRVVAGT